MANRSGLTLAQKVQRARELIDCVGVGVPFPAEALEELGRLSGTPLRYAVKLQNPAYPSDRRHLHVLVADWQSPAQWSWRRAIQIAHARDPEEARIAFERQKKLFALRFAIAAQMVQWRYRQPKQRCEDCGDTEDLTTDHHRPPFIVIALDFLESRPSIELRQRAGVGDVLADDALTHEWQDFHARRATYQILCRICNSAKGAR